LSVRAAVILTAARLAFEGLAPLLLSAESMLAAALFEMLFLFREKKETNRLMTYGTMFFIFSGRLISSHRTAQRR
jgi:hypothetical protein